MSAIDLLLLHSLSVNFRWLGTLRTFFDFCYEEIFSRWRRR